MFGSHYSETMLGEGPFADRRVCKLVVMKTLTFMTLCLVEIGQSHITTGCM